METQVLRENLALMVARALSEPKGTRVTMESATARLLHTRVQVDLEPPGLWEESSGSPGLRVPPVFQDLQGLQDPRVC